MQANLNIAFKEWAVVVDALGHAEQILILRKGGIRETRGEFHADHRQFWLFPTLFHEAEQAIIPSKWPALRESEGDTSKDTVNIEFLAVVDKVLHLSELDLLKRLQGKHIWRQNILEQRFAFGREPGLHALIVRIYRMPIAQTLALREDYGGCKSWIELERTIGGEVVPVMADEVFEMQRDEICGLLSNHAIAHS